MRGLRPLSAMGKSVIVKFIPAWSSLAQTSSAIIRGFVTTRRLTETGVANALNGSNLRLIQSFSCNSQKNVRRLVKISLLLEGLRVFPSVRRRLRLGLQYSPTVSRFT